MITSSSTDKTFLSLTIGSEVVKKMNKSIPTTKIKIHSAFVGVQIIENERIVTCTNNGSVQIWCIQNNNFIQ